MTTTTTEFRGAALGGGNFNIDIGTEMARPVSAALSEDKAESRGPGGDRSYGGGDVEVKENEEEKGGNGKGKGEGEGEGEGEKKVEVKDSSDGDEEHVRNDEVQRRREQKVQQVQKLSDREVMRRYQARKMKRAYHAARTDYEKKRYVSCRARALLLLRNARLRPEMRVLTLHLLGACSYYGLARQSFETALSVCGKLDDDVDPQGVLRSDTLALLEELELYRPMEAEGREKGKGNLWIEVFERDS